jgi:hypothetical protein
MLFAVSGTLFERIIDCRSLDALQSLRCCAHKQNASRLASMAANGANTSSFHCLRSAFIYRTTVFLTDLTFVDFAIKLECHSHSQRALRTYNSDPSCHFNAYPDPNFHLNGDPDLDPAPHKCDANLRLLV